MNIENNKIIAEFMEYAKQTWSYNDAVGYFTPYSDRSLFSSDLKFYDDWNWLMEVVEKIESLGYGFRITRTTCFIDSLSPIPEFKILGGHEETKKQSAYNACVEFIKWHNEQKQN